MEASSAWAKGETLRARIRWATSGVVVAFAAAMVLTGSGPAIATQGQSILAGQVNTATAGTVLQNTNDTNTMDACPPFASDIKDDGLIACGRDALWALGDATGVYASGHTVGVNAESFGIGVEATGQTYGVLATGSSTGVFGQNSGSSGVGVQGQTAGVGTGVYGDATANGVGVFGDSVDGPGVEARSTNGPALNVLGRAQFSSSGTVYIAALKSSVTVTGVSLTNASFVLATLQGNVAKTWVRGVSLNIAGHSFTIYLNKAVNPGTIIGWFIVD